MQVQTLATSSNINCTDTLYNKVVKDMCFSRGNSWYLKPGAEGL